MDVWKYIRVCMHLVRNTLIVSVGGVVKDTGSPNGRAFMTIIDEDVDIYSFNYTYYK